MSKFQSRKITIPSEIHVTKKDDVKKERKNWFRPRSVNLNSQMQFVDNGQWQEQRQR